MGDESSETRAKALFLIAVLEKPGVTCAVCLIERYSALMEPLARKHLTVGVRVTSVKSMIAFRQSVLDQDRMDFTTVASSNNNNKFICQAPSHFMRKQINEVTDLTRC